MSKHDPFKELKEKEYYDESKLIVLCDGGGTPDYPCYYSFKILDTPYWVKRNPLNECVVPKDVVWKQTNNTAELASVYYTLLFIRRVMGEPKNLLLLHDSQFAINLILGATSTRNDWLYSWSRKIGQLWWPEIEYKWIKGKYMKRKAWLGH